MPEATISVHPFEQSDIDPLLAISLAPEQNKFAATGSTFLSEQCTTTHFYTFNVNGDLVGFCKVDLAYGDNYPFCPKNSLGIRSLVIDIKHQGKGYGAKAIAALIEYMKLQYPAFDYVYLTVNCKNLGAYRCYQKAGFSQSSEKYLGGPQGPQYVMYYSLN